MQEGRFAVQRVNRFTEPGRAHAPLPQTHSQRRPFPSPLSVIQYNAFLTLTPNFILDFFAAADPPSTLRIASLGGREHPDPALGNAAGMICVEGANSPSTTPLCCNVGNGVMTNRGWVISRTQGSERPETTPRLERRRRKGPTPDFAVRCLECRS